MPTALDVRMEVCMVGNRRYHRICQQKLVEFRCATFLVGLLRIANDEYLGFLIDRSSAIDSSRYHTIPYHTAFHSAGQNC